MPRYEHDGAVIELPEAWRARVFRGDLLFSRAEDASWVDPFDLGISGGVERVTSDEAPMRTVRRVLRERVPQGYPEVIAPVWVSGRRALGVTYTDGCRSLVSWFGVGTNRSLYELWVAAHHAPDGTCPDVVAIGREWSAGLTW